MARIYAKINDPNDDAARGKNRFGKGPDRRFVGITCSVVTIPTTLIFASVVKEVLPDTKVVVGGPTAATCPEYLIAPAIDILVVGEGEETITELCEYLLGGQRDTSGLGRIKGIIYKSPDGMVVTEPRPLIADIDTIPFPDREAMFIFDNGQM